MDRPVPGSGGSPFDDGEVPAGPDCHGKTQAFQQGPGALHGFGRHPQLGGDGVVRGRDVTARASIRDRSVRDCNAEQGVDRDVCCGPCGLSGWSADGRLDLSEPPGPISPCRVAGVGASS